MGESQFSMLGNLALAFLRETLALSYGPRLRTDKAQSMLAPSEHYPRLGVHYFFQEIGKLSSFKLLTDGLSKQPSIKNKLERRAIEDLLHTFAEAVFAQSNPFEITEHVFDFYWQKLLDFFASDTIIYRFVVGLGNFYSSEKSLKLDKGTSVLFFGEQGLLKEVEKLVHLWDPSEFSNQLDKAYGYDCTGALVFDLEFPAEQLSWHDGTYSRRGIRKMVNLIKAMRISNFGDLQFGPWFYAKNPDFPISSPLSIGEINASAYQQRPKYILTKPTVKRIQKVFPIIDDIGDDTDKIGSTRFQNRLRRALDLHFETYRLGPRELSVVNIAIALEALLYKDRSGGSLQTAIKASNLLGRDETASQEIFENVQLLYALRNKYVHGDPISDASWDNFIGSVLEVSSVATDIEEVNRSWYVIEVLRDYVGRILLALMMLGSKLGEKKAAEILDELVALHLSKKRKNEIQKLGEVYPLARPSTSSIEGT